jgi:hypothetical protein
MLSFIVISITNPERHWGLAFTRDPPHSLSLHDRRNNTEGVGFVNLFLLEHSAPTPLSGRIIIADRSERDKQRKKAITIPLKTNRQDLVAARRPRKDDGIYVALSSVPGGASLQYESVPFHACILLVTDLVHRGSTFVDAEGNLDFCLEVALNHGMTETDCVVM